MSAANVDPALVLRRRALRRSEGKRRLAVLVGAVAILLLPAGYWALEHSSVFSASQVAVTRRDPAGRRARARGGRPGRRRPQPAAGERVVAGSAAGGSCPTCASARVDRAFPHTVAVTIVHGARRGVRPRRQGALRRLGRRPGPARRSRTPRRTCRGSSCRSGRCRSPAARSTPPRCARRSRCSRRCRPDSERDIARLRGVVSNPAGVVAIFGHGLHIRLGDTTGLAPQAAGRRPGAGQDGHLDPAAPWPMSTCPRPRGRPSATRNKAKVEVQT